MERREFAHMRKRLGKTQREIAQLLGKSIKAIHSYEQGWRTIPVDAERMILFLVSRLQYDAQVQRACWQIMDCPPERRKGCPAWELKSGRICWFVNGTVCKGRPMKNWDEKVAICRQCEVFRRYF
jgi:DNA-binding XRE family transcriptional regulator